MTVSVCRYCAEVSFRVVTIDEVIAQMYTVPSGLAEHRSVHIVSYRQPETYAPCHPEKRGGGVCICIYIYIYTYIYIYIHMPDWNVRSDDGISAVITKHIYVYVYVYTYIYIYIERERYSAYPQTRGMVFEEFAYSLYNYTSIYQYIYIYIYVHIRITYIYIYTPIYIYIYIYIGKSSRGGMSFPQARLLDMLSGPESLALWNMYMYYIYIYIYASLSLYTYIYI